MFRRSLFLYLVFVLPSSTHANTEERVIHDPFLYYECSHDVGSELGEIRTLVDRVWVGRLVYAPTRINGVIVSEEHEQEFDIVHAWENDRIEDLAPGKDQHILSLGFIRLPKSEISAFFDKEHTYTMKRLRKVRSNSDLDGYLRIHKLDPSKSTLQMTGGNEGHVPRLVETLG